MKTKLNFTLSYIFNFTSILSVLLTAIYLDEPIVLILIIPSILLILATRKLENKEIDRIENEKLFK